MKQNEIIEAAKEAGFTIQLDGMITHCGYHVDRKLTKFSELILASQAQPTPSQSVNERAKAEQQYTITAFDYVKNPVGGYEWCIYWKGWQGCAALSKPQPTSQDSARLEWMLDWFMRGGKLSEVVPNGHMTPYCKDDVIAGIDASMKESK